MNWSFVRRYFGIVREYCGFDDRADRAEKALNSFKSLIENERKREQAETLVEGQRRAGLPIGIGGKPAYRGDVGAGDVNMKRIEAENEDYFHPLRGGAHIPSREEGTQDMF